MAGEFVSFALHAVERTAPPAPPGLTEIGGVWIYGLEQLEPAAEPDKEPNSFVERWRDAICLCVGAEEFEKFCRR